MLHTEVLIFTNSSSSCTLLFLYISMYILFFKYKFKNKGPHVKDDVILKLKENKSAAKGWAGFCESISGPAATIPIIFRKKGINENIPTTIK